MQLSQIYSNKETIFTPISFNSGPDAKTLNVVFASVKHKKERDRDSHNLGKTTLIHLIDFLLLKDLTGETHFLIKSADRFAEFIFFLELVLHSGDFVTVRRAVANPTRIALKKSSRSMANLYNLPEADWDHWDVAIENAKELLDAFLNLRMIKPWGYRKGVSYFLRTQEDYSDFFQIQKFMLGKDREWKPYLAGILGLDHDAVHQKYILDEEIEGITKQKDQKKAEVQPENLDRGQLVTRIEIARDEIGQIETRLDGFDFRQEERHISKRIVEEVESRIAEINNKLYDLDADIAQLERSIGRGMKFDLPRIKEIFEESKLTFPDTIARSYEELIDFNKRLTRERDAALKAQIKELSGQRDKLTTEHIQLNDERQNLLQIIRDADTFRKYKAFQKGLVERRASLAFLENQLERNDIVENLERRLRELRNKRDEYVTKISLSLEMGSIVKTTVTQLFHRFVKQVLNINGNFSVSRNKSGNLEFEIKTTDTTEKDTSQSEGHTYKKLLCALFDLAVLKALEDKPFYHFVYHDGILEGLDNRKKLNVLDLIRQSIANGKIQYIISLIESDLPRSLESDQPIQFSEDEIILTLHDQGNEGRLFRMSPF